jgi:hypothetical protein
MTALSNHHLEILRHRLHQRKAARVAKIPLIQQAMPTLLTFSTWPPLLNSFQLTSHDLWKGQRMTWGGQYFLEASYVTTWVGTTLVGTDLIRRAEIFPP